MNTKMKVLSLAMVGMFGYAGSAFAVCPTSLTPPWTAQSTGVGGTAVSVDGGLEATPSACKLQVSFDGTANSFTFLGVVYNDSTPEPSYRFRFYVDPSQFGTFTGFDSVQVFTGNANTSPSGTDQGVIRFGLMNNGTTLAIQAADADSPGNSQVASATLPSGTNWVEGKVTVGASGTGHITVWVNATAESDATAADFAVNNAGWTGVSTAALGVAGASGNILSTQTGRVLNLDAFDSRRQTFIGQ